MPHPTAELFLGPPLEDEDLLLDEPWRALVSSLTPCT